MLNKRIYVENVQGFGTDLLQSSSAKDLSQQQLQMVPGKKLSRQIIQQWCGNHLKQKSTIQHIPQNNVPADVYHHGPCVFHFYHIGYQHSCLPDNSDYGFDLEET